MKTQKYRLKNTVSGKELIHKIESIINANAVGQIKVGEETIIVAAGSKINGIGNSIMLLDKDGDLKCLSENEGKPNWKLLFEGEENE